MTEKELETLTIGDLIRNIRTGNSYVVVEVDGRKITAVRAVDVSNAKEWILVRKSQKV